MYICIKITEEQPWLDVQANSVEHMKLAINVNNIIRLKE